MKFFGKDKKNHINDVDKDSQIKQSIGAPPTNEEIKNTDEGFPNKPIQDNLNVLDDLLVNELQKDKGSLENAIGVFLPKEESGRDKSEETGTEKEEERKNRDYEPLEEENTVKVGESKSFNENTDSSEKDNEIQPIKDHAREQSTAVKVGESKNDCDCAQNNFLFEKEEVQKKNKFLDFSKKWWWIYLIIAAVIALSVVIAVVVLTKDNIYVAKAEDFNNISKGNIYILKNDITVDGDLTLSAPYSIKFNGHKLIVSETLNIAFSEEKDYYLGSIKDKKPENGMLSAKALNIDAVNASVFLNVRSSFENLSITSKKAKILKDCETSDISIFALNAELSANIISKNAELKIYGAEYCGILSAFDGNILATNSGLYIPEKSSAMDIIMCGNSTLDLYGKVQNIKGGALLHFRKGAFALSVKDTLKMRSYDYSMPEFIGNTVDIINVYSLSVPYGITFTEVNSELYCVFPAVQNAEGYFLSVDGGEKIYIPWAENNTSVKINLTSYLKNAGEHSVTVSAATSVGGFTESESVTVKYTFSTKLNAPITSSAVLEDGRVILSFENIAFADYYTVSINESSYLDINNTAESIIKVDITSYVKDIAGIYYISVRARSKNVEYYKDSDTVNLSYINYIKLAAPTLSATLEGDSINLSWNNVEHAQCYAVYENGALYAITKNSSLSLPFSNSDALFRVIALGYDFYLSSNAGECSLTNE